MLSFFMQPISVWPNGVVNPWPWLRMRCQGWWWCAGCTGLRSLWRERVSSAVYTWLYRPESSLRPCWNSEPRYELFLFLACIMENGVYFRIWTIKVVTFFHGYRTTCETTCFARYHNFYLDIIFCLDVKLMAFEANCVTAWPKTVLFLRCNVT